MPTRLPHLLATLCLTIGLATPSWADATLLNVSYDVTRDFYKGPSQEPSATLC